MNAATVSAKTHMGVIGWTLAAACSVLAAVLVSELQWPAVGSGAATKVPAPSANDPGASASMAVAATAATAGPAAEPIERFREIVERPIFHPARRLAPPDTEEAATAAATEFRNLTLVGVLISSDLQLAIFRDKGPEALRVATGAKVGRWSLAEVRPDGVTLKRGGDTRQIPLHKSESAKWSAQGETRAANGDDGAAPGEDVAVVNVQSARPVAATTGTQTRKAPTREERYRRKQQRGA